MFIFLQSTNLPNVGLIACAVRVMTRGLYVKRFWSGIEINKMLLLDNRSGVLLSSAGAQLPNMNCASLHQIAPCAIYWSFPKPPHSLYIFRLRVRTFTNLADAFIQSDLQCIQAIHLYCQYVCSLGIEPTTFALLTQCSNH